MLRPLLCLVPSTLLLAACARPSTSASSGKENDAGDGGALVATTVDAAASPSAPSPAVLFALNPARKEYGFVARYPGFTDITKVAGRLVLDQCYFGNEKLRLKILDEDALHGKDITLPVVCENVFDLGNLLVVWSKETVGDKHVRKQTAMRIPSGEVVPYPDFDAALHIGTDIALSRCEDDGSRTIRILDADRLQGRDVKTGKPCAWHVLGVLADAVMLQVPEGEAQGTVAVHIPSGQVEPYTQIPGRVMPEIDPRDTEQTFGTLRYRRDLGKRSSGPTTEPRGLSAYDARSDALLWHMTETDSLGVPSEGGLMVLASDSLAEVNPETGKVLWEYGVTQARGPLVGFTLGGADAVAFVDGAQAAVRDTEREVILLARGATATPAWSGTIRGTYHGADDPCGRTADHPLAHRELWIGATKVATDAQGKFALKTTGHGSMTVAVHGVPSFSKVLTLDPAKSEYVVDVSQTWETGCWPEGYTK